MGHKKTVDLRQEAKLLFWSDKADLRACLASAHGRLKLECLWMNSTPMRTGICSLLCQHWMSGMFHFPVANSGFRVHFLTLLLMCSRTAGNFFWVLLCGWWLALVYEIMGAILFLSVIGSARGSCLCRLGLYVFFPFGTHLVVVLPEQQEAAASSPMLSHEYGNNFETHRLKLGFRLLWGFLMLPLLIAHAFVLIICYFPLIFLPMARISLVFCQRIIWLVGACPDALRICALVSGPLPGHADSSHHHFGSAVVPSKELTPQMRSATINSQSARDIYAPLLSSPSLQQRTPAPAAPTRQRPMSFFVLPSQRSASHPAVPAPPLPDDAVAVGVEVLVSVLSATNWAAIKLMTKGGLHLVAFNSLIFLVIALVLGYAFPVHSAALSWSILLCSIISMIPLSYFIGQAIAILSAQTSFAVGALLNASFTSSVSVLPGLNGSCFHVIGSPN